MPRTYLFRFCDPVASFSEGSPGVASKRISGSWGDRLGIDAWRLGRNAYGRLRSEAGGEVSIEALLRFMESEEPFIDDFIEDLVARAAAGKITLVGPEGQPQDMTFDWRGADWSWKLVMMMRFIDSLPQSRTEPVGDSFGAHMMVAALLALDNAVLCSLDDDSAGVSEHLLEAAWLVERVDSLDRATKDADALLKVLESTRASERAKRMHAATPKRRARDFVRECWEAWRKAPGSYPSASAFARAMLDKQPDQLTSEVVVSRWVRQWNKETDTPNSD